MGRLPTSARLLHHVVQLPTDAGVMARLGMVYAKLGDDSKAMHYYMESHRVYPANLDVLTWLGAQHAKKDLFDEAMGFFELASQLQPDKVDPMCH